MSQTIVQKRKPIFFYPALPEIKLCFAVTIATVAYAWYCVYLASTKFQFKIGHMASVHDLPLIGQRFRDDTNWEWFRWRPHAFNALPFLAMHSILFNIGEKILPTKLWTYGIIGYSMIASAFMYTPQLLGISLLQGILLFATTYFTRSWKCPYQISVIVIYPEFEKQLKLRKTEPRNWKKTLIFIARIAFWWALTEAILYFFYFEAMLTDYHFAFKLPKNEFVTLGMAMGSFFHLKYVVIFGYQAVFARLDNMRPPDGPICISRVALYSKIWRAFDRGLYAYFKEYIFIPICAPTFSIPRKIFGVFASYTFVLIWHGFQHHNIVWIGLNIIELFLEYSAKILYSNPSVQMWREKRISDVNFRRILGWLQVVCFAVGLYSNFYFLGGSQVGQMFVQRIFWEETWTLRWPFFLLITLGYFYMQVAMEVDRNASLRAEREEIEEAEKEKLLKSGAKKSTKKVN
uniref:Uncharacterized protein n=1 Tax=Panagrolaimus sp. PS1159 TaxID=55785 RepID=A0AC35FXC0_9BILA